MPDDVSSRILAAAEPRSVEDFEAEFLSGFQEHYDDPEAVLAEYKALIVAATREAVAQRIEQNADVINGFAQPGREAQLMAFLIRLPDGVPVDGKEQQQ